MAITFPGIISQINGDCISSSKRGSFSTCTKAQKEANIREGYLVSNLWFLIARDFDLQLATAIRDQILKYGLSDVVAACSSLADALLLVEEGLYPAIPDALEPKVVFKLGEIYTFCSSLVAIQTSLNSRFTEEALGDILQVLRFPKRFAYPHDPEVIQVALASFLELNNRHRSVTVSYETRLRYEICERARYWSHQVLKAFKAPKDSESCFFTSGAVAESGVRTLAEKISVFWQEHPQYGGVPSPAYAWSGTSYDPSLSCCARVHVVPKNYKTGRTIAMISTSKQFHLSGIRIRLEDAIGLFNRRHGTVIHIGDQESNQALAKTLKWATIDFSSASDSISRAVAKELLPASVYSAVDPYLDQQMSVKGRVYPCHIFALSGTSVTWVLESVIFWSLAKACTEKIQPFFPDKLLEPHVYGDDTLIDPRVLGLFYEVTGMFGMRFNRSKSFSEGGYRESCGAEYYFGYDTQSIYFPRGGIDLNTAGTKLPEAIESLIALQHRLLENGFRDAAEYAASVVRDYIPNMTSHKPGEECADLWEDFPVFMKRYSKHYSTRDFRSLREGHYTLVMPDDKFWFQQDTTGLEAYTYVQYLQDGPQYQTELDRLLGVSQSRLDTNIRASFRSNPEWRVIAE